mgnify:CR=1 FL=1
MFTYFLGFPGFDNEWKVMGLAAYGTPKYKDEIGHKTEAEQIHNSVITAKDLLEVEIS